MSENNDKRIVTPLTKHWQIAPQGIEFPANAQIGDVCFITPPCLIKTDKGWTGLQIDGEIGDDQTHVAIRKPVWRKFSEELPNHIDPIVVCYPKATWRNQRSYCHGWIY